MVDDPVHSGLLGQADELGEVQALGQLDQVGLMAPQMTFSLFFLYIESFERKNTWSSSGSLAAEQQATTAAA